MSCTVLGTFWPFDCRCLGFLQLYPLSLLNVFYLFKTELQEIDVHDLEVLEELGTGQFGVSSVKISKFHFNVRRHP